ncbi:MAG: hypothetical protein GY853_11190 [PVC group bacterium]|nr:hypothetical protein [PVC group bacterium]
MKTLRIIISGFYILLFFFSLVVFAQTIENRPIQVDAHSSEYNSFLHYYTDLIRKFKVTTVEDQDYVYLDQLVEKARSLRTEEPLTVESCKKILKELERIIDEEEAFNIGTLAYTRVILPIGWKGKHCFYRSLMFHSLGQEAGIPIYVFATPKGKASELYHFANRVDLDGKHSIKDQQSPDNEGDFCYEATRDVFCEDAYYLKNYNFTPEMIEKEVYGRNLDDNATIAAFVGHLYKYKKKDKRKLVEHLSLLQPIADVLMKYGDVPTDWISAGSALRTYAEYREKSLAPRMSATEDKWRLRAEMLKIMERALDCYNKALSMNDTDWIINRSVHQYKKFVEDVRESVEKYYSHSWKK